MHSFEIGTTLPKPIRQACPLLAKADVLLSDAKSGKG